MEYPTHHVWLHNFFANTVCMQGDHRYVLRQGAAECVCPVALDIFLILLVAHLPVGIMPLFNTLEGPATL